MDTLKEYPYKEAERWLKAYPQWKESLPGAWDLFNYETIQRVEAIERSLQALNEEDRKLLEMLQRNKSYIAIGMTLHMSETTVWRAKKRLLRKLAVGFGIIPARPKERARM